MTNSLGQSTEPRHNRQAALMFDLIAAYVDGDARRVDAIAIQISATGVVDRVLNEAIRFTTYLSAQAETAALQLTVHGIRTSVLSRLTKTVPAHHELAAPHALDLDRTPQPLRRSATAPRATKLHCTLWPPTQPN